MNLSVQRSPLFYVGDKWKLLPQLLPLFPERFERLCEPFVGGASVAMNSPASEFLLNDADQKVIELHQWLASSADPTELISKISMRLAETGFHSTFLGHEIPDQIKATFPKTYFAELNRDAYLKLRADYNSKIAPPPLDLFILLIHGFNRMIRFNQNGNFNVPVGNLDFNSNVVDALIGYVNWAQNRKLTFNNQDFSEFFELTNLSPGRDFVYLDPPYLISQAAYNSGWSENEEKRLLDCLDYLSDSGVRWGLSNVLTYKGNQNKILKKWAGNYKVHPISANYISFRDNKKKETGEVFIVNFEN